MATAKNTRAKDRGEEKPYTVLANLRHDGEAYAAGDAIALDDATAMPLLDVNVIEPAKG